MNLIGKKFNRLLILELVSTRINKNNRTTYLCRCDCGKEKIIDGSMVKCNRIKSCGCLQKEIASNLLKKGKGVAGLNSVYRSYERGAKKRNLLFNLSKEELKSICSSNCYYCNSKPNRISKCRTKNAEFIYNGIDRVDNKYGYSKENSVPCCFICNSMKSVMKQEDFLNQVNKIAKNYEK